MKKVVLSSLFALLFITTLANAATLFYGGDLDLNDPNQNGLANENDAIVGGNPYGAATFQNFIIKDPDWDITSLWTNNLSQLTPISAYYEIRSGVSEGNGGTLIASGTVNLGANYTHTPTGRSDFGYTEYQDHVSFPSIDLNSGQYWFAVVPNCPTCAGRSFNSDTDGLNSVGSQTTGQQYFDSAFFGANFTNANNEGVFNIFSSGVDGTVTPEPSSLIMLGSGLVGVAGVVRRRLSR